MRSSILIGVAFGALVTGAALASPAANATHPKTVSVGPPLQPSHAVLRYDASAYANCRSFSDASSEICLLLALHVIRMSQRPLAATSHSIQ